MCSLLKPNSERSCINHLFLKSCWITILGPKPYLKHIFTFNEAKSNYTSTFKVSTWTRCTLFPPRFHWPSQHHLGRKVYFSHSRGVLGFRVGKENTCWKEYSLPQSAILVLNILISLLQVKDKLTCHPVINFKVQALRVVFHIRYRFDSSWSGTLELKRHSGSNRGQFYCNSEILLDRWERRCPSLGRGNTTLPFGRVSLPLLISALSEEGIREYAFESNFLNRRPKNLLFSSISVSKPLPTSCLFL